MNIRDTADRLRALGVMLFIIGALLMAGGLFEAYSMGFTAATREVRNVVGQCFGARVLPRSVPESSPR